MRIWSSATEYPSASNEAVGTKSIPMTVGVVNEDPVKLCPAQFLFVP